MHRPPTRGLRMVPLLLVATAVSTAPLSAQCPSGVKPRVLVMVDSSASMTLHLGDSNPAWGDGSIRYTDAIMTRDLVQTPGFGLYTGYETGNPICPPGSPPITLGSYDGINSRLYAVKSALPGILNAPGEVDWGLMRFAGTTCPIVNTTTSNFVVCGNDSDCASGFFCLSGTCFKNNNLCALSPSYDQACHRTGQTVLSYSGTCGTSAIQGSPLCATPQVCYSDAECTGARPGQCAQIPGSAASSCTCFGGTECPAPYTCSANRCIYNLSCQNPGGTLLVDPSTPGAASQIFPWVDGIEANVLPGGANPELRASGNSPLAGAARSATSWYTNIKNGNLDPQILCRGYALVQITDGLDSCEPDANNGPVAAAASFVAATPAGAKRLNKVYVIGVALGTTPIPALDAIAKAGGTGSARLANSSTDIQAALADIVQSMAHIERCNNADDDCNGTCDEPFPDVAVTNPLCPNRRSARSCDNGSLAGTHCFASGVAVCSADQLSERCSAPTCSTNPALCPTPEAVGGCNGLDDDCNGSVDDCTPFVPGSCCP